MTSAQQVGQMRSLAYGQVHCKRIDMESRVLNMQRWLTREWFKANKAEAQSKQANRLLNSSPE